MLMMPLYLNVTSYLTFGYLLPQVQMRNKWRNGFHFGHGGSRRLPCFQKSNGRNDVANNRNIYVTHSRPQNNFGVNTMPSMEHYMEVRMEKGKLTNNE